MLPLPLKILNCYELCCVSGIHKFIEAARTLENHLFWATEKQAAEDVKLYVILCTFFADCKNNKVRFNIDLLLCKPLLWLLTFQTCWMQERKEGGIDICAILHCERNTAESSATVPNLLCPVPDVSVFKMLPNQFRISSTHRAMAAPRSNENRYASRVPDCVLVFDLYCKRHRSK